MNKPSTLRRIATGCAAALIAMLTASVNADPAQARIDLNKMGVDYSETRFAQAAGEGDRLIVERFLEAGMDVNAGGGAALGLAAGRGRLDMVKFLLEKGAKPTANALQFARTRGHAEIEKLLQEASARE